MNIIELMLGEDADVELRGMDLPIFGLGFFAVFLRYVSKDWHNDDSWVLEYDPYKNPRRAP